MAEFKFSCPQCNQHIQCDVGYSGRQINCPSCQKEIVVPQAPPPVAAPPLSVAPHNVPPPSSPPPPPPPPVPPPSLVPPLPAPQGALVPASGQLPYGAPRLVSEPPPKSKSKILLWSAVGMVVILIAGLAVAGYWWMTRPQVITFKDGSKLTLIGATYGKNHVAPKIKVAGKLTRGSNGAQMNSADNALVVWVEYQHKASANQYPNYQFYVYDKADTACVGNYTSTQSQVNNAVSIVGYMFNAYPRWDKTMIVRVVSNGNGNRQVAKEQFTISNPKPVSVPQWTAESLPDKKTDGDLTVTLTKLDTGARGFNGMGSSKAKDPMNKAVLAAFHTEQKGVTATNWQPVGITTTDASGNHGQNNSWSTSRDQNGDATMTYQWGLWPDQPWKLRVEMSRTAGFDADEFWSVTNVPVSPGNQQDMYNYGNGNRRTPPAFAETTLQGIHLKIYPALQFTNMNMGNNQKQGGFRIMADPDPTSQGFRLTLSSATDEQGHELQNYNGGGGGGNYQFQLQNIRNTKMLNVTVALNKSRFFEFTVKPSQQAAGNNN